MKKYNVFYQDSTFDLDFDSFEEAAKCAIDLSLKDGFKGDAIYIFNRDEGHIEGIYTNGGQIV